MDLPKLYRVVVIKFWSLRNGIGNSGGVIFDEDEQVTRMARRVLCTEGWKWFIKDYYKLLEWDWYAYPDQEMLDEFGSDLEVEIVPKMEIPKDKVFYCD